MSYRSGIGPELAARLGGEACDPHVKCDRCGVRHGCGTRQRFAAAWFLDGKPPPGWKGNRKEGAERRDWCPKCRHLDENGKEVGDG